MKVIAINGSPRQDGNTMLALTIMMRELEQNGIQTELIQVGGRLLHGCMDCNYCTTSKENLCAFKDDIVNETVEKMRASDGFIIGAPTYYGGIPGTMKSFLDRVFYTSSSYFAHKVATAVTVARRTGGLNALQGLQNYLALAHTATPPSQYWTVAYGNEKGEVLQDAEGMQTLRDHAREMIFLLHAMAKGGEAPQREERIFTNFIR